MGLWDRILGKQGKEKRKLAVSVLLHHPTTVVTVETDKYLREEFMCRRLAHVPHVLFGSPDRALEWMEQHASPHPLIKWCEDVRDKEASLPDLFRYMRAFANDTARFYVPSIMLTNYIMKDHFIDGLHVCKHTPSHMYKILQSVIVSMIEPEKQVAADAMFNKTVKKEEFYWELEKGRQTYFDRSTESLRWLLESRLNENESALFEPGFAQLLSEWEERLLLTELYLWDSAGSYLFGKRNGAMSGLCVRTQEQVQHLLRSPQMEGLPKSLQTDLRYHVKTVCRFTANGVELPEDGQWEQHVYPVTRVFGQHAFDCCYVPEVQLFLDDRVSLTGHMEKKDQKALALASMYL